jgi:lysozyme
MKRSAAALVLVLANVPFAAASTEPFGDAGSQIGSFRALAQAQKKIAQAPRKAMGKGRLSALDEPSADATPDVSAYAVRGIDISHYEGTVDWGTVAKDGLSFVYVKATEGEEMTDDQFQANWQGAAGAGLARGAYHFYDFCEPGATQADNFIKTVPVEKGSLPPTIDLEQSADCKKMPAKAAFLADLNAFVQKIQDAYGVSPVLYVNGGIYNTYLTDVGNTYALWIADVSHVSPVMPDGAPWTMWQYGWHGAVAGIGAEVDLDVFRGTTQELASLELPASGAILASAQ